VFSSVVLIWYWRRIPFWCSKGGGSHLSKREKAVTSVIVMLAGGADGAARAKTKRRTLVFGQLQKDSI